MSEGPINSYWFGFTKAALHNAMQTIA